MQRVFDLAIKDQLAFVVRSLEKEKNRRKMLRDEVAELQEIVETLMLFLDGSSRIRLTTIEGKKVLTRDIFSKKAMKIISSESEETENGNNELDGNSHQNPESNHD